jgi:hypothetical protein
MRGVLPVLPLYAFHGADRDSFTLLFMRNDKKTKSDSWYLIWLVRVAVGNNLKNIACQN